MQYFNSVHAQKPIFLPLLVLNYFSCPFPFLFLGPFTLAIFFVALLCTCSSNLNTTYASFMLCCFGCGSVGWLINLNTCKWDILPTGVAVYFDSKLRTLKLQTCQIIRPAKVREKPPAKVEIRENGVWREGKFPSFAENAAQNEKEDHI